MNINFYVKSMESFIILSVIWYERLTKCYLLHTDLSEFRELGKTCQVTCFFFFYQLWTTRALLNIFLGPPNRDFQNSPNETHELGSWAKKWEDVLWAWTMGFDAFLCKYGLFWALEEIFQKFMIVLTWCGPPMKWSPVVWKNCPQQWLNNNSKNNRVRAKQRQTYKAR